MKPGISPAFLRGSEVKKLLLSALVAALAGVLLFANFHQFCTHPPGKPLMAWHGVQVLKSDSGGNAWTVPTNPPVIVVGPSFQKLSPAGRQSLLGHEFGHVLQMREGRWTAPPLAAWLVVPAATLIALVALPLGWCWSICALSALSISALRFYPDVAAVELSALLVLVLLGRSALCWRTTPANALLMVLVVATVGGLDQLDKDNTRRDEDEADLVSVCLAGDEGASEWLGGDTLIHKLEGAHSNPSERLANMRSFETSPDFKKKCNHLS